VTPSANRVLLVFIDGMGIGTAEPGVNPWLGAQLPNFRELFGGRMPVLRDVPGNEAGDGAASWVAADATLGVAGLPQSGTGQTALLTGENAAREFGRHFGPWIPTVLRDLLAQRNLLSRAAAAGERVAFANAIPRPSPPGEVPRRPGAVPLAAQLAGVLDRHLEALREGRAVASSITNERWRRHFPEVEEIAPEAAGERLSHISRQAELTLFAHYDTDYVGHRGDLSEAVAVLERVDRFLSGVLAGLPGDTLLVIASDHGNIEDASVGHTTNPVPVIAVGPGAEPLVRGVRSITDVAPALLRVLNVD